MGTKQQLQTNNTNLRANDAKAQQIIRTIQNLPPYQSPIGKYIWKVYNKDTKAFIGYIAGSKDQYPTAGVQGDYLYVANFDSIEELTWAQIAEVSTAGVADSLFSVGDEKNITVNGETLTLVIAGFNHDDLAGGGKAGITFGLKHLMKDQRQMNSSNTNSGGFPGSAMYSWLQNTLLKQLPSDLQAVLKSVNKKTSKGSASSTINTNAMKLFLFSEIEIFGTTTYSASGEGTQYPYFATAGNRIKHLANGTGSADWWWERSSSASNSNYFCYVNSDGNANVDYASGSYGVCFGFCV